ncbi:hypothetical protein [Dehalogenimonas alkenigignens]|uniref:hypothetical protein n=1 Tax=Dehalogenimonas alkenigignens TaxID=1217799 RepID=UPI000D56B995|nr:hypothetical protein [Dehalogenimonas alkenigignens]PVV83529.1 hypothetical protein DD509_06780 [Dehalogenimonas alkenigignens]
MIHLRIVDALVKTFTPHELVIIIIVLAVIIGIETGIILTPSNSANNANNACGKSHNTAQKPKDDGQSDSIG